MNTTKEISIFRPPEVKKTLTKTERSILFERLELDTEIPHYHFESFNDLENKLLDESRVKSDIPAVLIKNNIEFLVPIVKKKSSKEFHISVQLNVPVHTKNLELQPAGVYPSNSQIEVIGVSFSNNKNYIIKNRLPSLIESSSLRDKLISGIFGLYSWYYQPYHDRQIKRSKFFQDETHLKIQDKQFVVHFKNKDDAIKSLNLINNYVNHTIKYYNDSLLFIYSTLEYPPFSNYTKNILNEIKPLKQEKYIFKNPLLKLINSVYTNNITLSSNRIVLLYDLVDGKLWSLYQFAKMLGLDDPIVKNLIKQEKDRQEENKIKYEGIKNELYQKNKYHKKLFIARSLFYKNSLDELTEKELGVVNLTYKKDLEFSLHVRKSKCAHLKFLERVMKSKGEQKYFDRQAWEELKKLIPYQKDIKDKCELLKCSVCDLSVLCPHHYDIFEYDSSRGDKELRLVLLKKYADKTPIKDAYYCKICGEKIVKKYTEEHSSFIQGKKVHVSQNVDTMSSKIWREVRSIISNHITFGIITDTNILTTNITDTIQPYIEDEQTKLKNIKTNTPDIIQNTVYLYICIYAYASIVRIMSHHPGDIQFKKDFKGFRKSKPYVGGNRATELKNRVDMKVLQNLLKTGLSILVSTKLSLIKNIPNISIDSVKPMFVKAFKNISKLYVKTAEFNTELPPEYVANSVIYSYLYYIKNKHDPQLKYSNIVKILGVELNNVSKLENITDNVTIPGIWKLQPPDEDTGFYNNTEHITAYHKYAYDSFIHFINYVKNDLHKSSVFNNVKHENHRDEYMSLMCVENSFKNKLAKMYAVKKSLYYNKQYGEYNYSKIDLSKIFCPNGQKHKFNVHVYEKGVTRLEISENNINEWMFSDEKNKEFRNMTRVDLKCSACGSFLSKTKDVDGENSITNVLNRNDEIIGFYNLYTFKCPVKDTHIFEGDKCKHCDVTKIMIFKKDTGYYKKYRKEFRKELVYKKKIIKKDESYDETIQSYKPWVINDTPIIELSKMVKVNINVLNNIGLIEGNDYEKIESGEYDPGKQNSDDENSFSNQVVYMESYMNTFLIEYEMLKNGNIIQPQLESFVKRWENIDFSKFPPVATEYHNLRRYYNTRISKKDMVNFILCSLSKALIDIYKYYSAKSEKTNIDASIDFIKYIVNKIIDCEKIVSDPGILRGKLIEFDDDDGDAIDADYDDRENIIDENFDPFSLESTGIDPNEIADNGVSGDD